MIGGTARAVNRHMSQMFARHSIAVRLPLRFEPEPLQRDLAAIPEEWWGRHLGPYHDGNWESVALWAPGGSRSEQKSRGAAFAATEALAQSPGIREVVEAMPGTRSRIRLMRLRPGGAIFRHSDPMEDIDPNLVRLHLPIATNPAVDFRVDDRRIVMLPGELWHVDVRFPHEVRNGGDSMRVHLVMDLIRCSELEAILAAGESMGEGRLTWYFAKQKIPRRVRVRLGLGN
jgi:Aspartyl/Asparaginyl beta-hydroxylase